MAPSWTLWCAAGIPVLDQEAPISQLLGCLQKAEFFLRICSQPKGAALPTRHPLQEAAHISDCLASSLHFKTSLGVILALVSLGLAEVPAAPTARACPYPAMIATRPHRGLPNNPACQSQPRSLLPRPPDLQRIAGWLSERHLATLRLFPHL